MKIGAVICEYNPFHLGHAYMISEMKRHGAVVAVMSGSFTQRGEAAVVSKYVRARAAVLCGADLVLELPFPYSAANAETFAAAGVDLLSALGCVDSLWFGSESGDISALSSAAENIRSATFLKALRTRMADGHDVSYRHAFAEVYTALFGGEALSGSNDILAVCYLMRLAELDSVIRPCAVRRIGERYNGEGEGAASAGTVRRMLSGRDFDGVRISVPGVMDELLRQAAAEGHIADTERLFPIFAGWVRACGDIPHEAVPDMTAELAARLSAAALQARNMEELLSLTQTKRYSRSRVRRALLYALMDVRQSDLVRAGFTTVLAANGTGREILSSVRKTTALPIVTKPADYVKYDAAVRHAFELSVRADSVWELLCPSPREGAAMMREHPIML